MLSACITLWGLYLNLLLSFVFPTLVWLALHCEVLWKRGQSQLLLQKA